MKNLLRIGDFARIGGVSIKTLRFYATETLLTPAHVDPATGYRYYRIEQTERLALIVNLRAAGFSIAEIAAALAAELDADRLGNLVEQKRVSLRRQREALDTRLSIVDALTRCLHADDRSALSRLRLTPVGAQLAHSLKRRVDSQGDEISGMFEQAESTVASCDARASAPPFLIFHAPPIEREVEVEVCIPVTGHAPQLSVSAIPGFDLACAVVYQGDYDQTPPLKQTMIDWVHEAGLRPAGPLREIYHRFGADQTGYRLPAKVLAQSSADFLTELQLPVTVDARPARQ